MFELIERQKITGKFSAGNVNRFLNGTPEYDSIKTYFPDFLNIVSNFSKMEACRVIKDYYTYRQLGEICYVPETDKDMIRMYNQKGFLHSKDAVLRTITHYKGEEWDDTQVEKIKAQCYIYLIPSRRVLEEEGRLLKFLLITRYPDLTSYSFEVSYSNNPQIEFSGKYYNNEIIPSLEIPACLQKYSSEQREEIFDKAVGNRAELIKKLYPDATWMTQRSMIYMANEENFKKVYVEGKTQVQIREEEAYNRLFQYLAWREGYNLDECLCYIEYEFTTSSRRHVCCKYKEIKSILKSIIQKAPFVIPPHWNNYMADFYLHICNKHEVIQVRRITFTPPSSVSSGCVIPLDVEGIEALKILVKSLTKIKKGYAIFQNVDRAYGTSRKTISIPKEMIGYFSFLKSLPNIRMYPISDLDSIREREGYKPYIVKTEMNGEKVLFKVQGAIFKIVSYYVTHKEKLKEVVSQSCTNIQDELELISLF